MKAQNRSYFAYGDPIDEVANLRAEIDQAQHRSFAVGVAAGAALAALGFALGFLVGVVM